MATPVIALLHQANSDLRAALARCQARKDGPVVIGLRDLLPELARATDELRTVSPESLRDPELRAAMFEYRDHMQELAQLLPKVLGQLLTEKARLEDARSRAAAAAAWAGTNKNIL